MVRQVEQGARLLAAPPHGVRVILQMPRGNLEGICPRVLVLAGIAAHLQVEEKDTCHSHSSERVFIVPNPTNPTNSSLHAVFNGILTAARSSSAHHCVDEWRLGGASHIVCAYANHLYIYRQLELYRDC